MHFYPSIAKEQLANMTNSSIQALIHMIGYVKNPERLEELKPVEFASEYEFEQYILRGWGR